MGQAPYATLGLVSCTELTLRNVKGRAESPPLRKSLLSVCRIRHITPPLYQHMDDFITFIYKDSSASTIRICCLLYTSDAADEPCGV